MKLIAGLGNPGAAYALTRHNIGFIAADRLAEISGITLGKSRFEALTGSGTLAGRDIVIAKPLTYMNLSGPAIASLAAELALRPEDILVIHDDMDFGFGDIRVKTRGGSGGHRGVASLIESMQTDAFVRLRVGIGHPPEYTAGADYVLQEFSPEELSQLGSVISAAMDCINILLEQGIPEAMNKFHIKAQRQ